MKLYRFSPITNTENLIETIKYIATQSSLLSLKILGTSLPIKSLTVFSHYELEYYQLEEIIRTFGNLYNFNNGLRIKLHSPIQINYDKIEFIRIRQPDPYRMQVGCNDFEVENYFDFKDKYLEKHNSNLRLFVRENYEMIEFFDPDFDVLGYIVSN